MLFDREICEWFGQTSIPAAEHDAVVDASFAAYDSNPAVSADTFRYLMETKAERAFFDLLAAAHVPAMARIVATVHFDRMARSFFLS